MATKDKRATEKLNVALAGVESCLSMMGGASDPMTKNALDKAKQYCEEARDALLTIQFHAAQI